VSTGRIYISHDIVFDETVFPFASLYSNAGARLREEINLLPLSLQPFNLHYHGGHDLQGQVDVDPTNDANTAAESVLQDPDHEYTSDDYSSNLFMDPKQDSPAPAMPSTSGSIALGPHRDSVGIGGVAAPG
jgi:hypothetical protein